MDRSSYRRGLLVAGSLLAGLLLARTTATALATTCIEEYREDVYLLELDSVDGLVGQDVSITSLHWSERATLRSNHPSADHYTFEHYKGEPLHIDDRRTP